jgi:hypothetical protein
LSVFSVLSALQATGGRGGVRRADFVTPLAIGADDPVEHVHVPETAWSSGLVQFPIVRLSECQSAGDAVEAADEFFARVQRVLRGAAGFLNRRETAVFEGMRAKGLSVCVFVDLRMDQDQFDFELPAEFVRACGRQGLGISLTSNDISAEEAIRAGAR